MAPVLTSVIVGSGCDGITKTDPRGRRDGVGEAGQVGTDPGSNPLSNPGAGAAGPGSNGGAGNSNPGGVTIGGGAGSSGGGVIPGDPGSNAGGNGISQDPGTKAMLTNRP